jgi:adenosylmethionine-8-amino-7-oxononanoate aminotransferase
MIKGFQARTEQHDLAQRSVAAVCHPCTQKQHAAAVPPLLIQRSEGPWLFGDTGRYYFDTSSSPWVNLFGHADAHMNAALKEQLDCLPNIMVAGCTHAPALELVERLPDHD